MRHKQSQNIPQTPRTAMPFRHCMIQDQESSKIAKFTRVKVSPSWLRKLLNYLLDAALCCLSNCPSTKQPLEKSPGF